MRRSPTQNISAIILFLLYHMVAWDQNSFPSRFELPMDTAATEALLALGQATGGRDIRQFLAATIMKQL